MTKNQSEMNQNLITNRLTFLTSILILFLFTNSCQRKSITKIKNDERPFIMCSTPVDDSAWYDSDLKAPLFKDLGKHTFPINTGKKKVQRYFDQGLILAYGFNHAEAARSFYFASKLEPTCAMAHWGYAYTLGPNYNAGMAAGNYAKAYKAIQNALRISKVTGSEKEKFMIQALATRYPKEPVENRFEIDSLYALEMEKLHSTFPKDPDIATLYAESLLNLHPWNLWEENGNPKPWTPKILDLLESTRTQFPNHPGAHHFYIHAIEASKTPEKGLVSARALDSGLTPGAGHLMHMPSHIYIRTGDYHSGSLSNLAAIEADSSYITSCRAQGAYPLIYHPHNEHFLAATATLEGNRNWAIKSAEQMSNSISRELIKQPGWALLQHFYTIPYHIYVKFGEWDKILTMNELDTFVLYPEIIKEYAKGMAYLGKKELNLAKIQLQRVQKLALNPELEDISLGANSVKAIVDIAELVLKGEISSFEGHKDEAIQILREAVSKEDALNYIEPPDWFFSVRHNLGNILLQEKRYTEAVEIYKEDLQHFKKNGWALSGLIEAYKALGQEDQLQTTIEMFEEAWQYSDIRLVGSKVQL